MRPQVYTGIRVLSSPPRDGYPIKTKKGVSVILVIVIRVGSRCKILLRFTIYYDFVNVDHSRLESYMVFDMRRKFV